MAEQLKEKQKEIERLAKINENDARNWIINNASKKLSIFLDSVITQQNQLFIFFLDVSLHNAKKTENNFKPQKNENDNTKHLNIWQDLVDQKYRKKAQKL